MFKKTKESILIVIAFLTLASFISIGQDIDSASQRKIWYKSTAFKTVAAPTVLIVYGVSTIGNHGIFYSSKDAQKDITATFSPIHNTPEDYLIFTPIAAVYGLNLLGIKGKHNGVDVALLYTLSFGATSGITFALKYTTHQLRPDNSDYLSFPSGHTSSAFVAAEIMHQEYKDKSIWYSVAGYSAGVATGALRMINNKHWMSDVLVGAGIGILVTKVTYLYYPWFQKEILRNKTKNLGFLPTIHNKGAGISFIYLVR